MKYILELEDEPNKEYFGEGNYYRCKQIPYWSISESMRNRLEPYDEADRKTENSSEKPNNCDTCKWGEWYRQGYDITMMDDECGGCCSWNSKWTPKDEPQTDCAWK